MLGRGRGAHAAGPMALEAVKTMDVNERADHAIEAPATHAQQLPTTLRAFLGLQRVLRRTAHTPLDSAVFVLSLRRRWDANVRILPVARLGTFVHG